jgi:hypothetical protein
MYMSPTTQGSHKRIGRTIRLTLETSNFNTTASRHWSCITPSKTPLKDLSSPYRQSPRNALNNSSSSSSGLRSDPPSSAFLLQSINIETTSPLPATQHSNFTAKQHAATHINQGVLPKLVFEENLRVVSPRNAALITQLQQGPSNGPILWIFHSSTGSMIDECSQLVTHQSSPSDLTPPCTIYAISSLYFHHGYRFKSITQMARIYLHCHVRKIQRKGPYFFAGLGLGGVCAREMAALLTKSWEGKQASPASSSSKRASQTVSVLLLDTFNPSFRPSPIQQDTPPGEPPISGPSSSRATATCNRLKDHQTLYKEVVARLLLKHVPTPFRFGAPTAILASTNNRSMPIKINVRLLKAADPPSPKSVHHPCQYNGWLDESVAPGLKCNTRTVPLSHDQLFNTPQGNVKVSSWIRSHFE